MERNEGMAGDGMALTWSLAHGMRPADDASAAVVRS